jgi:hypothetical protein
MNGVLIAISIELLLPCAYAAPSATAWKGHDLAEVRTLAALPKPVQNNLLVKASGLEGIADRGGRFNVTDVVDADLPMRRFILAGTDQHLTLVALEHGGRAHYFEAVSFSEVHGELVATQRWALDDAPKNLRALISSIEEKERYSVLTRKEAENIAQSYFKLHVGCGAYTGISESTNAWVVEGKIGYAGTPIKGFFIDKTTGHITSTIGPSYANQEDMRRKAPK